VGIAARDQERIFEEFYQVPSDAVLDAHQRKGLGLGLAIVKRLSGLIGAPLALRSVPGRGSVFTLELPVGRAPRAGAAPADGRALPGLTLDGRHIVIVEDEPAVRSGLEVLLRSWGAQVTAHDSVGACERGLRDAPPGAPPPDLVIADYRLGDGRTGIDAIVALRARWGAALPVIVVTGSAMTVHEDDAQRHGFHLLVKPVVPNKLRAMIAFKLAVR